jgi:hypothetical protein
MLGTSGGERGGVLAVVEDADGGCGAPAERQPVDAAVVQPVVQVDAERPLSAHSQRGPCRQGHSGDLRELDGDLDGGVAATDHHDALSGVRLGPSVGRGVEQLTGVAGDAGQRRHLRRAEQAGGGDHRPGGQRRPAAELDREAVRLRADRRDAGVGADREREVLGVLPQVRRGLVTVRIPALIAGERQARQRAVPRRGEQGEGVVEVRPRAAGLLPRLQDGGVQVGAAERVSGGESG